MGVVGLFCCANVDALDVERLAPQDVERLRATLQRLEPLISAKKHDGTANLLSWEELYAPLSNEERALLDAFRALKAESLGATTPPPVGEPEAGPGGAGIAEGNPPTGGGASHYFGEAPAGLELVAVGPQQILKDGTPTLLDPQFLPNDVHIAYVAMTDAMERDLGKRLLVESGYRSPAYQLYLFLFYLPKHNDSIRETNRYVALPGYSEHGAPMRQAIDFINQDGINGEDNPEDFEVLPEYQWLLANAHRFGFHLSYPRNNPYNTAFEPWHWHYESSP